MFQVRFTDEARGDLVRLYAFVLKRTQGHPETAEASLHAIEHGLKLLETSPFACRPAAGNPFLRELVIGFGASGYVALFEIEDARTVTVLAVRHQREQDYR
jgi:plasmid stabilization system protein ParE